MNATSTFPYFEFNNFVDVDLSSASDYASSTSSLVLPNFFVLLFISLIFLLLVFSVLMLIKKYVW